MPRRIRKPTKARPARPRLRGAACRRPRRLLGRDRLRSVGSVRSQADEARRHAGGRTSGNGPDTAERAPLDARGWVPSVFRARPAIKMQECPLSLFRARTGRRRRRGPTRREEACENHSLHTVGAPPKKHPASLQGTLGFLGFDGFTMESMTFAYHKSVDFPGFQGWVSCGRFLVAELLLY